MLLEQQLGQSDFYIKRLSQYKHILYLKKEIDFIAALELFKKTSTNFYSYTLKQNKNLSYILKGLHNSYTEDEIFTELKNIKINDVKFTKVTRLQTKKSKDNNVLLPVFIVQLSPDSNPSMLKNIKTVNYQLVHWERLKKKEALQCKRCQRVGHAAINCGMTYRCVKCQEGHGPGECSISDKETDRSKLYCVNCKGFGHPASYRGCPGLLANINKIKEKELVTKENRLAKIKKIENYIKPNISFAEASKGIRISNNYENTNMQKDLIQNHPNFNAEFEIFEIKRNFDKFMNDQQNKWSLLEKLIKNNSEKIDLLAKNLIFKNG